MSIISLNANKNLTATAIPNLFIDNFMGKANAAFVVVYIFFYRHYMSGNSSLTIKYAAESLNLLESDVINSFKYWEKEGLIKIDRKDDDYEINFLPFAEYEPEKPFKLIHTDKFNIGDERLPEKEHEKESCDVAITDNAEVTAECITIKERPKYSPQELEIYKKESKDISLLFSTAEKVIGKYLTFNDLSAIFGLYDWLRLPLEVITLLLSYCADNNHRSIRYIERVAIDWAENGIDTVEKANSYIKKFNVDYREILKAFGNSDRNPTPAEIKYMQKWLTEFAMPLNLVLEACDKTIMQIGKPRLSYTDKIITGWFENGVTTIEQVRALEEQFAEQASAKRASKEEAKKPVAKTNKFVNFKQRSWDYEQIEKMERKYLENSLS